MGNQHTLGDSINVAPFESEIAEQVLISLLAVNRWSLERVYGLRRRLRDAGLLDFDAVADFAVEEVARRLAAAGYSRGDYMNALMAIRVCSMAQMLSTKELGALADHVRCGRRHDAETLLAHICGVGPSVLRNFWILQER
jgi:hypothetical protein